MGRPLKNWPAERPVRTLLGFAGIALGAAVAHRVQFDRSAHIPSSGPAIVVANHLATTETLALARLITGHHRFPHFLAKSEVFSWPLIGRILTAARQIPVMRGATSAAGALGPASLELNRGHLVCLYPEGHLTREPDLRPGPGKTGAARLALTHPGVPVIPVGLWGAKPGRSHLWHRHTVRLIVGEPMDLSAFVERADADAVGTLTDAIMARITDLAGRARGEPFGARAG